MVRMLRLALATAILVAIVSATSAAGSPSRCRHGVSSIGPAVVIHAHLVKAQSDLAPHRAACVRN